MKIEKKTIIRIFIGVAACIILYCLLSEGERVAAIWKRISGLFAPFVGGAALAFILNVPMRSFEGYLKNVNKLELRRLLALLLTLLAFVLVLALVFYLLIPQITATVMSIAQQLPGFFTRVETMSEEFLQNNPQLMNWIINNTDIENFDWNGILQNVLKIAGNGLTGLVNRAFSAIGSVSSAIVQGVISLVFAVYCLFRKEILARQGRRLLYSFVPEKICDETVRILRLTNTTFSNFISGQCLEAIILGALFAVAMAIFGMPYIPLVSVLVAVTALVPVVGAFVGCVFGAFFILVDDPMLAVWFVVMFLVIQQIENNMIYPRVVGTSIGLPGMWVLLAVTVGGGLMGVGGMLLMIPLASVVYTLLREITNRRLADKNIPDDKLQDHPPEPRPKRKAILPKAKPPKKK